jgi:ribosomal protein S18 acetylase RimI-like enzyme
LITCIEQWGRDLLELPSAKKRTWRFERYGPELADEFAATVARTYEGTLDCPELNGIRAIDEIMAGHRAQGKFHPDYWWLAIVDGVPAGVVLLAEMADGTSWELAYLGVVPEQRGRGLARSLLTHALHALSERSAAYVILAVDERNRPARRLYEALGFVQIESSDVYLYVF